MNNAISFLDKYFIKIVVVADMIFVPNFTLRDFQAKNFTPQKGAICVPEFAGSQAGFITGIGKFCETSNIFSFLYIS